MKFLFETTKKKKESVHTIWVRLAAYCHVAHLIEERKAPGSVSESSLSLTCDQHQADEKRNTCWPCTEISHEAIRRVLLKG